VAQILIWKAEGIDKQPQTACVETGADAMVVALGYWDKQSEKGVEYVAKTRSI
jgi:hypothetical protein